ncbi:cellulose synthase operon protein YhjQ/BcsQ [Shigella sonnei]
MDANCHIPTASASAAGWCTYFELHDFRIGSQVQDDIYELWLQSQRRSLPMLIHRDEAMGQCLAAKQRVGEFPAMRWRLKKY